MSDILNQAKGHFESIFNNPGWGPFTFHSVHHTWSVVEKAQEWAKAYKLESTDSEALQLAAMFHDLGYLSRYDDHETEGIRMFFDFAEEHDISENQQGAVKHLIECTRKTHSNFEDPLCAIMHDIDRAAMGMTDFIEQGLSLRKEWEHFKGLETNDIEWFEFQIQYLTKTEFKTDYGISKYNPQREKNLQLLRALVANLDA